MELINQHTKKLMEECKQRAWDAGLRFGSEDKGPGKAETLEYIVTNRDLNELTPKLMIPTFYDYWVHDVEVLKEKGRYELYPQNPHETVINTWPAISFYNDNNPDWMNVMIFYHVLAHIAFFRNNLFFRHTWDYDFNARALADKQTIAKLRSEHGRWTDYIIEFARGIDNLAGYHREVAQVDSPFKTRDERMLDYYFGDFLRSEKQVKTPEYLKEIERYNGCLKKCKGDESSALKLFLNKKDLPEKINRFMPEVLIPEKFKHFSKMFEKKEEKEKQKKRKKGRLDVVQYILEHSDFLKKDDNEWMKQVVEIVRNTSLFFQPQIRTKIMNEGWASYWHEKLFLQDRHLDGHEADFARTHAFVTSLPRVGINPYAIGMKLFQFIEETGDKGKYSFEYHRLQDAKEREDFDSMAGLGQKLVFKISRQLCDSQFINRFVTQDFVNKYKLFVAGRRLNQQKGVWEYYVKSRKAEDYRQMLLDVLYHPPYISIDAEKSKNGDLYLYHHFENKPLVRDFIANTMLGIEYLWGKTVKLETSEAEKVEDSKQMRMPVPGLIMPVETKKTGKIKWERALYTMKDRKLSRVVLTESGVHKK